MTWLAMAHGHWVSKLDTPMSEIEAQGNLKSNDWLHQLIVADHVFSAICCVTTSHATSSRHHDFPTVHRPIARRHQQIGNLGNIISIMEQPHCFLHSYWFADSRDVATDHIQKMLCISPCSSSTCRLYGVDGT